MCMRRFRTCAGGLAHVMGSLSEATVMTVWVFVEAVDKRDVRIMFIVMQSSLGMEYKSAEYPEGCSVGIR